MHVEHTRCHELADAPVAQQWLFAEVPILLLYHVMLAARPGCARSCLSLSACAEPEHSSHGPAARRHYKHWLLQRFWSCWLLNASLQPAQRNMLRRAVRKCKHVLCRRAFLAWHNAPGHVQVRSSDKPSCLILTQVL